MNKILLCLLLITLPFTAQAKEVNPSEFSVWKQIVVFPPRVDATQFFIVENPEYTDNQYALIKVSMLNQMVLEYVTLEAKPGEIKVRYFRFLFRYDKTGYYEMEEPTNEMFDYLEVFMLFKEELTSRHLTEV